MKKEFDGIEISEFSLDDLLKSSPSFVEEYLYLKELQERKLYLNEEITIDSVDGIVRNILRYNKEDKGKTTEERRPIFLYISSDGGDVDSGLELIDVIESSKTPVYTVNLGYCYSMAFVTFLAGHKRFASRNAKFLLHDGNSVVSGSAGKAQDTMSFVKRLEKRLREYILSKTSITYKEYQKNFLREWYMFAEEAKSRRIVDFILGTDVDIDDIT